MRSWDATRAGHDLVRVRHSMPPAMFFHMGCHCVPWCSLRTRKIASIEGRLRERDFLQPGRERPELTGIRE